MYFNSVLTCGHRSHSVMANLHVKTCFYFHIEMRVFLSDIARYKYLKTCPLIIMCCCNCVHQ